MSRGVDWPDVVLISMLVAMFTASSSSSSSGGSGGGSGGGGSAGSSGSGSSGTAGGGATSGSSSVPMRCEDARLKCAYRTGCGMALQYYSTSCATVLQGDECTESCQHALIALTSTVEGKALMTCQCAANDALCLKSKQRVETCRSSITNIMNRTRVSCRIATWICNADTLCQTALAYYQMLCKSMFQGRKCTHRCLNSINILRRQEAAAKLNTCICDGSGAEEYDCKVIHRNMNSLCFGKMHDYREIKKVGGGGGDTRTNEILRPGDSIRNNSATRLKFPQLFAVIFALLLVLIARRD